MSNSVFLEELQQFGPHRSSSTPGMTRAEARRYCRRLARRHYENFTVAGFLVPRDLRPHFYHLYAYCRWADDLADETQDAQHSLQLLDWWQEELEACYCGRATHPVFVALEETIHDFAIPIEPLLDLLTAFRQDQHCRHYETFDQLLGYCRCSANPVGHLVLYLARDYTPVNARLADSVCTGLQLANFWQDVARDFAMGRVYLPQEDCRRFGVTGEELSAPSAGPEFRRLLQFQVDRAEIFLLEGEPLIALVPRWLQVQTDLFIQGGLAILNEIRRLDYNVLARRPVVGKWRKLRLVATAQARHWLGRTGLPVCFRPSA